MKIGKTTVPRIAIAVRPEPGPNAFRKLWPQKAGFPES